MPPRPSTVPILLSLLLPTAAVLAQSPQQFRFAREDVLGTSSSLVVVAPDEATAKRAEAAVFAEVARLAGLLSTWDEHSELARLQRSRSGAVSPELAAVLQQAEQWRRASGGALEPGVASLTALWQAAAQRGKPPAEAELAAAAAALREPAYQLADGALTVRAPFTLDGFAKGHIVELASRAAALPGVQLVSFQIGGDTRIGPSAADVALVDPRQPAANGVPLRTLRLQDRAVASSGGYARGFDVAGVHHSHILDPRTGRPCDGVLGASVVAADVATADALATLLCVLGPTEGLQLLAKTPGAEGLVVTADGSVHESPGFAALTVPAPPAVAAGPWPPGFALQVDFTILGPAAATSGRRGGWKRPYVAVWVEDLTGAPARTLCLWIEDQRWLRDLRRWSRQHAETPEFVGLVSQATRKAGTYTLSWDGTDHEGRALAPGKYTVLIEVSREHGSYQLMKKELELGTEPASASWPDNAEIGGAKVTFGKVAGKDPRNG